MSIIVDLTPDLEAKLSELAARTGRDAGDLVRDLLEIELSLLQLRPTRPPAWLSNLAPQSGKNGLSELYSKWPDPPNEKELEAELDLLHESTRSVEVS